MEDSVSAACYIEKAVAGAQTVRSRGICRPLKLL
jgi:hypothetical protein